MKKDLTCYNHPHREIRLPDNIKEFINRPERQGFKKVTTTVNKWLFKLTGRNFSGGTAIGKNYGTLILDINYQDGAIRISQDGDGIEIGEHEGIFTYKQFEEAMKATYNLIQ